MVVKFEDASYKASPSPPNASPSPPATATSRAPDMREFIGNAKRITVECNRLHLRIIGNGNKIFVTCNVGRLEILGNNNRVKIVDNSAGKVNFVGNNSKIYLSSDAPVVSNTSHTNVRFTGLNGSVKLVRAEELRKKSSPPASPTPSSTPASSEAVSTPPPTEHGPTSTQSINKFATSSSVITQPRMRSNSNNQHASDDDLTRHFDQHFGARNELLGISVNNMNVSLDNLCSSVSTADGVRISAAKSNLVINNLV